MTKVYYSVLTILTLLLTFNTAQAQLFEDFEGGSKGGYASGSVTLSSGDWYLDDALLGSDSGDIKNGSKSVRIRNGGLHMEFDVQNGADTFSFYGANSGFSNDTGGKAQVYYSTDNGSSWTSVGDEITLTENGQLEKYDVNVVIEGPIRFKIEKTAGGRISIDDVRITDYIVAEDEATIDVLVDGDKADDEDAVAFSSTLAGTERQKTVTIKNRGNEVLEISDVTLSSGSPFSVSSLNDSSLAFNESTELTLIFSPESEGAFGSTLQINSNAVNTASFTLNISGDGFEDGDVISISEARELPFGTRVTVAGRVTVANEFEGPVFMQDKTAGIAVFWNDLHIAAEIGDSIIVTGPLTEFNPVDGPEGDFLTQIAATDDDNNIIFEVVDTPAIPVNPTQITVQEMNAGDYEGQLVLIERAAINHTGTFQGNTNYELSDGSGSSFVRIDANSNLVGASAPSGPVNIVGVVDQFYGDYQLKPRFAEDMGVEEVTYPGEDVSKDQTFDVVTWNIEWFGGSNGPEDDELQLENVKTVITTIDADLYAFQEISNPAKFAQLVDELEEYGGILADFSQTQKTAYLFKRSTIDSLSSGLLSTGMTTSNWANGRFPLFFQFKADINGDEQEFYSYNIHAKAFGDESSYNQRFEAAKELKQYLDNSRADDNVIFLGDYNDEITSSTWSGASDSPYKNFDDDAEYTIITKSLEESGLGSHSSGSFLDHITVTSELMDEYFEGTERVENPSYVGSYLSTTSDHFPIWTRFKMGMINSTEELEKPLAFTLEQNYPNPFNPSTVISYTLDQAATVSLEVFDVMGRKVTTLVNGNQTAGRQQVSFDASMLSSGVYMYRLSTSYGQHLTRKMLLLK